MIKNTFVAVVVIIALFGGPATCAPKKRCTNEAMKEKCIQTLFMIENEGGFPTTIEGLNEMCAQTPTIQECIHGYMSTCMTPIESEATMLITAGMVTRLKKLCSSDIDKNDFIETASCGNAMLESLRSCNAEYTRGLNSANKAPNNQKFPIYCCKVKEMNSCALNSFNSLDEEVCPLKARLYLGTFLENIQSDMLSMSCSDYFESSDLCEAVDVPALKPSDKPQSQYKALRGVVKTFLESLHKESIVHKSG